MKEYIIEQFNKTGINIDDGKAAQFLRYYEMLIEWNQKFNLTTITQFEDVVLKHFIDSSYGLSFIKGKNSLCDIGAGAGFPSLVLKILYPEINITLMDSLNKRVVFLQEVVNVLGLANCNCVHVRAEDAAAGSYRESFDVATARAVAGLNTLCEYALPLVKTGGIFIAYKGEAENEIAQAKNAIKILGGKIDEIKKFNLADTEMNRSLIIIGKTQHTDKKYPRGKGKEKSNPL